VGLLGGPPLYHQKYGSPMMRARHMPFPIDEAARQVWLSCFDSVLANAPEKYNFPEEHLPQFREFLVGFSGWMVNTA
jgi:hemoglobin